MDGFDLLTSAQHFKEKHNSSRETSQVSVATNPCNKLPFHLQKELGEDIEKEGGIKKLSAKSDQTLCNLLNKSLSFTAIKALTFIQGFPRELLGGKNWPRKVSMQRKF